MKKFFVMSLIGLLSLGAYAQETQTSQSKTDDDVLKACTHYKDVAEQVMKTRQAGVDASKMMEVAEGNPLMQKMIIVAFDTPSYSTEAYKEKAVSDFANEVFLDCYKKLSKKK